MNSNDNLRRWRLILGKAAEEELGETTGVYTEMDNALSFLYDNTETSSESGGNNGNQGGKHGGKGKSSPKISKWLGDIRSLFPEDCVRIIERDAIKRKGLNQLLFEPEIFKNITPDIHMVGTILSLKNLVPEKSKEAVREYVRSVVEEIKRLFEQDLRRAVSAAINHREHSPIADFSAIDIKRTINRNLRNFDVNKKRIIPENFYFYERRKNTSGKTIILAIDESGSMAESAIYSGVMGSILASIPALKTRIIAFDTEVTDLTEAAKDDPVDLLFGIQLGGGTDINKAVSYGIQFIENPGETVFFLISDLFEGGVEAKLLQNIEDIIESGVTFVSLLALSDNGKPSYDEKLAKKIAAMGAPCFACPPENLPRLLENAIKGNVEMYMKQID
jgi:Mg-chelatase subunit ChlD